MKRTNPCLFAKIPYGQKSKPPRPQFSENPFFKTSGLIQKKAERHGTGGGGMRLFGSKFSPFNFRILYFATKVQQVPTLWNREGTQRPPHELTLLVTKPDPSFVITKFLVQRFFSKADATSSSFLFELQNCRAAMEYL